MLVWLIDRALYLDFISLRNSYLALYSVNDGLREVLDGIHWYILCFSRGYTLSGQGLHDITRKEQIVTNKAR